LAKAIEKKFGVKTKMIESGGGVFEVAVDGKTIFSKKKMGRFPDHEEIFNSIQKLVK